MLKSYHCFECHFFSKNEFGHSFSINENERERSRNKDFTWKPEGRSLMCAMGVWNEGASPVNYDLFNLTV